MTRQPSEDDLRSSTVQSMNYHLEQVGNLTDDSKANAIIRNMFRSGEINLPSIRELDSEDAVDVIASLASVISDLYWSLNNVRDKFPELQQAREK